MGNCSKTLKKTNPDKFTPPKNKPEPPPYRKVDISDILNPPHPAPAPSALPVVRLYGSPSSPATSYIHFAILYKPVTLLFIPSETPDFGFETPVIQYNADVISGSSITILRYLDSKFPKPLLLLSSYDSKMPLVVTASVLHHKSLTWHLERMVTWSEDLATRGGKSRGDPVMGSGRMEVK
nr:hypothetical protein [Tanacetum cinerariifolium]